MATLTPIVPDGRGIPEEIVLTAVTASDKYNNTGLATDLIIETGGTATVLTIVPVQPTREGDSNWPAQTVPNITASIGANKRWVIPAVPKAYMDVNGDVTFACTPITDVKAAAVKRVP